MRIMECMQAGLAALSALVMVACDGDSTTPSGSGGTGAVVSSSSGSTAASTGNATGGATGSMAATGSGGAGPGGAGPGGAGPGGSGPGGGGPCAPSPGCDTTDFPANGTCESVGLVNCSHAVINCCIPAAQQNNQACNCFSKCAAPDTPIATPAGDIPIAALGVGDRVYSVSGAAVVAVPLLRVQRVEVVDHEMVRAFFGDVALDLSPGHPTADGRTFGALLLGDALDGSRVTRLERVRIARGATYDILPDSQTGAYFAGGVLVGSTLARSATR